MSRTPDARIDVQSQITAKIIAAIEAGAGTFRMPWHQGTTLPLHLPENVDSRKRYRGGNIVSLWITSQLAGYRSNVWGTYKQWQGRGAQVRKGEKGALICVYKEFDDGTRMFAKASWVFNAEQVDGATLPPEPAQLGPIARIAAADDFLAATGARIEHGGTRAFYRPSEDRIQMPSEGLFFGPERERSEAWYSTALHELTHWSGAPHRLNREKGKRFGDKAYAFEELVAELGAAFLCAQVGISNEPRQDHAQYIAHWLDILKADKRAIFSAASAATAAADYLARFSDETTKAAA